MRVAGRILTALVGLFLIMNGVMTALRVPHIVQSFTRFRYTTNQVGGIGVTLLACTAIYFIPRTAVLGAILLTGYLGGAAVSHLPIGEPETAFFPISIGVLVWLGLFLRDDRLRRLIPLRKKEINQ